MVNNNCINCKSIIHKNKKYCNNKCQNEYQTNQKIKNWLSGKDKGWTGKTKSLKRFIVLWLKSNKGSSCEECGWDEYHPIDNNSLTEIDHIDGNAENCKPSNLKILCPNCHSMTPTFRNRNKNSKRER